jgi:hypothetical protein
MPFARQSLDSFPKNPVELRFCHNLAAQINGQCEFPTPCGRIDILTENSVIEAKIAHNWKHGIGQLFVYGSYFPNRKQVLWLIGEDAEYYVAMAKPHCDRAGVELRVSAADFHVASS